MATCTKVKSGWRNGRRSVTYYYDDGSMEIRTGGNRAWRNNNPGNVIAGPGEAGKDYGQLAVFPDVPTGRNARRTLFAKGGKYYGYDSARHMLRGNFDKDGHQLDGTGYAPKWDGNGKIINDPDAYADFVRQFFRKHFQTRYNTDMDIEETKLRDYTPEMLDVLEEAQETYEGFARGRGKVHRFDKHGNPISGALDENRTGRIGTSFSNPFGPHALDTPRPVAPRNALAFSTSAGDASPFPSPYETASSTMRIPGPHDWPIPPGSSLPPFRRRNLLAPAPPSFEEGYPRPDRQREEYDFFPLPV